MPEADAGGFPHTANYRGLNTPQRAEYTVDDLAISGTIPADVAGTFFRAVPDPAYPPFLDDAGAILSADGMISAIRFAGGKVSTAIRYVGTARHRAEVTAGRALFGRYRNPFTDRPEAAGIDRTVANTTPVWHAGRLLMTKEDGRPYRIDPATLDTLEPYDFGGALRSQTFTAHVRIDPATGEMFAFGYQAAGLATPTVAYLTIDAAGTLVREQWFEAPYCAMMHDFAITEHYALFPIYPTSADLDRLRAGGEGRGKRKCWKRKCWKRKCWKRKWWKRNCWKRKWWKRKWWKRKWPRLRMRDNVCDVEGKRLRTFSHSAGTESLPMTTLKLDHTVVDHVAAAVAIAAPGNTVAHPGSASCTWNRASRNRKGHRFWTATWWTTR